MAAPETETQRSSPFVEGWDFVRTLGEGAYGEVKLAVHRESGECVAVKIMNASEEVALSPESLRKEICIMKMLKHKNVVRFYGQRSVGSVHYLFLEYADGGELFYQIEPDHGMEPGPAHHFFLQLISGVDYLHSRGVAHRDIKPENLLLDRQDVLKISDFGLSTVFKHQGQERKLNRRCGTPPYIAPEVYAGLEYSAEPADMWSCGVVLVALLAGELPWDIPSMECPEYCEWCRQNYFLSPWTKISNEPLALLKKILRHRPNKRYTIERIKSHVWFKNQLTVAGNRQLSSYPVFISPTQDNTSIQTRHTRKIRIESSPRYSERSVSMFPSSQPVPSRDEGVPSDSTDEAVAVESFTQPSRYDEMVMGTQVPCTPGASQAPLQRLSLRTTRFYSDSPASRVWGRLQQVVKRLGWGTKTSADKTSLVVSAVDSRKERVVFKGCVYKLRSNLVVVEFRRSKGDGIEFKKMFRNVKNNCSDLLCKPPEILT